MHIKFLIIFITFLLIVTCPVLPYGMPKKPDTSHEDSPRMNGPVLAPRSLRIQHFDRFVQLLGLQLDCGPRGRCVMRSRCFATSDAVTVFFICGEVADRFFLCSERLDYPQPRRTVMVIII